MKDFSELKLSAPIARAISELGFERPTPIQSQTIPTLLEGPTDFLGMAATGTGKTAAYGIPLLSRVTAKKPVTEAVILCPTRELAKQITDSLQSMGKYLGTQVLPIYGGSGYDEQIRGLKRGAHIVVATPGRLLDHLERGTLKLQNVETVVLDEADEMISMGFAEDLEHIFEAVNADEAKETRTWLFSATMQPELRRIADRYLEEPVVAEVNQSTMLSGTVEQVYYAVREDQKPEVVCRILDASEDFHGLIFCQTKTLVDEIDRFLRDRGYASDQLHGDRSQSERERTLARFRKRQTKVLVCTDVAARGLDIKNLSHVINYSIPRELDSYVHRIGRTGRSGQAGVAISLVTPSHFGLIKRIEKMTNSTVKRGTIPSAKDVALAKVRKVMHQFMSTHPEQDLIDVIENAWGDEVANMSTTQIISRFLCMLHPELLKQKDQELGIDFAERDHEKSSRNRHGFQGRRFGKSRREGGGGGGGGDRGGHGGGGRPWRDRPKEKRKKRHYN